MSLVATLISSPDTPVLGEALARKTAAAMGARESRWLAEGVALDLKPAADANPVELEATLRETLSDVPVDIVVQEEASRRKRILVADMDSTMIGQECIDELAAEVGLKEHVAAITERAMRGEIEFEPALRERVALLRGLPSSVVGQVLDTRITLTRGARELVATMRANGGWTALVSGGFTAFTDPIAARIGFDEQRANLLVEEEGRLAGKVAEPVLGRLAKAEALQAIASARGLAARDVMAVGDGANDLDMIALAGAGVAFRAKPAVAAQARMRIDHGDLTALLYIQGYSAAEFAR